MLEGYCLIMFPETMEYKADEDGTILVFESELEAREYAEEEGLEGYEVIGLLDWEPEGEESRTYRNFYRCPNDGTKWQDEWSCMCNDRCPKCNAEIEPYRSKESKGANKIIGGILWKK